jgi:FkbM family methyltransferase
VGASRLALFRSRTDHLVTKESRARVDEIVLRSKQFRRRILDPSVLRGLLPVRAKAVRLAAERHDSREREQRFNEASSAYRQAVSDHASNRRDIRSISIDGMQWSVPLAAPDDPEAVEHALTHQHFPYRVITQTREVALGGTMIDIGANTGRMSIPRVVLGDASLAYCAEPEPLNYACLVRNVTDNHLNGLVLPDHLAIGADDGVVRLERTKSTGGHRVIGPDAASKREVVEVRSLRLDTWVDLVGIDLDLVRFVKVDVQGSEVDVLRGATRVLERKHIAWQIEIDLKILARRGHSPADLYGVMQEHFTHFIDLNGRLITPRVRPIGELPDALAHVTGGTDGRTDVLLFTMGGGPRDAE